MRRINFNDVTVRVAGAPVLCQSVDATVTPSVSESVLAGAQSPEEYVTDSFLKGVVAITHYLSGANVLNQYTSTGAGPFPVDFGGMTVKSGYLESYSLNIEPHKLAISQSNINFYEDLVGKIVPSKEVSTSRDLFNYNDIKIIETGLDLGGNVIRLDYSFKQELEPNILAGSKVISDVKVINREANITITSYQDNEDVPIDSKNVYIAVENKALDKPTENLIFNPNFDIAGTGVVGYRGHGQPAAVVDSPYDSSQKAVLSEQDHWIMFAPVIQLEVGEVYTFSFDAGAYSDGAALSVWFYTSFGGDFITPLYGAPGSASVSWYLRRFSYSFVARSSLTIMMGNRSPVNLYLSKLQLEKGLTPTPFVKHSRDNKLLEIDGVLTQKKTKSSYGESVISEYQVRQVGYGKKPVFGRFAANLYDEKSIGNITAGEYLYIYGLNLDSTTSVIFRPNIEVNDIIVYDNRVIAVKVPLFARTGGVKITNSGGSTESVVRGVENQITIVGQVGGF